MEEELLYLCRGVTVESAPSLGSGHSMCSAGRWKNNHLQDGPSSTRHIQSSSPEIEFERQRRRDTRNAATQADVQDDAVRSNTSFHLMLVDHTARRFGSRTCIHHTFWFGGNQICHLGSVALFYTFATILSGSSII
jgi:hypothetical protein